MRGIMIIISIAALITLVTPLIAQFTGDRPSAVTVELMVFITVASFFAGPPRRPIPTRNTVQGG